MKKEQLFTELSDEQAEKVVGGAGAIIAGVGSPVAGAGVNGWGVGPSAGHGLGSAGFTPPGVMKTVGANDLTVRTPGPKGERP